MKKTVRDIDLTGKVVVTRCDFNVGISNGEIEDDSRIVKAIPTIEYMLDKGAKVILLSHQLAARSKTSWRIAQKRSAFFQLSKSCGRRCKEEG